MHTFPLRIHPEDLRWEWRACAIIATVIRHVDPDIRYHRFIHGYLPGVDVAIADHGSGDRLIAFFTPYGTLLKGFDHESPMSPHARADFSVWPGLFDEVPPALLAFLDDPRWDRDETTFCIWRPPNSRTWFQGDINEPDEGEWSGSLLENIYQTAEEYLGWARFDHKTDFASEPIEYVYANGSITRPLAALLNDDIDWEALTEKLRIIGVTLQ